MKNAYWSVVLTVVLLTSVGHAGMSVVLYDNFDDGVLDGWSLEGIPWRDSQGPDIVASPEGYSLRGRYSGYYGGEYCDDLVQAISLTNVMEVSIEMRAKAGPQSPNLAAIQLLYGSNHFSAPYYEGNAYGESFRCAQFTYVVGSTPVFCDRFGIGDEAYDWHDYKWMRDSEGWWSLYLDDQLVWEDFRQDSSIMSFSGVALNLSRDQSEIEWVRISANVQPVPAPSAALLSIFGVGMAGWSRRRGRAAQL